MALWGVGNMDIFESDLLLLVAAGIAAISALLGVFVIAARVNKIREQLGKLAALQTSIQAIETDFAQIVKIVGPMSDTLPPLAGLGLHFRQIKRDQFCLFEKLKKQSVSNIDINRERLHNIFSGILIKERLLAAISAADIYFSDRLSNNTTPYLRIRAQGCSQPGHGKVRDVRPLHRRDHQLVHAGIAKPCRRGLQSRYRGWMGGRDFLYATASAILT